MCSRSSTTCSRRMAAEGGDTSDTLFVTSAAEKIPVTGQGPQPEPDPYPIFNGKGKGGCSECGCNRWAV